MNSCAGVAGRQRLHRLGAVHLFDVASHELMSGIKTIMLSMCYLVSYTSEETSNHAGDKWLTCVCSCSMSRGKRQRLRAATFWLDVSSG